MAGARHITKMMRSGLLSLLVCALLSGYVVSYFDSAFQTLNLIGLTASGVAFAVYSFVFGAPVVVVYGIPVFAFLHGRGHASWLLVLFAALVPAILLVQFFREFAAIVAAFGIFVAVAVRWVHGPGPNNSFKPTPLRGAA